ncbi:MAG TPA: 16S rRNA (guanine(527)-N(7))-methyltransferase RsmG [Bacteroidetes bacterium]|nr:16S rRNA (guanine(527)-N(7))-methyltransferase RsmG [Bacteroidota bacterium]
MAYIIEKYFTSLSEKQKEQFNSLQSLYQDWNEKINVISRKDIENFYERHVLHSLSIAKLISFKHGTSVLDFGTGGGFPGIPLAIFFPEVKFHLVDSIGKKITVVKNIIESLHLKNVTAEQIRVEELNQKYDFITCRAVAEIPQLLKWTKKLLSDENKNEIRNGWLFLKGGDLSSELSSISQKYKLIAVSSFFKEEFFREKWLIYLK